MQSGPKAASHLNWGRTVCCAAPAGMAHDFVDEMLARSFVHTEDWKHLPGPTQERILAAADRKQVLAALVEHRLLTEYQATRIAAGTTFGLVLGNYRILDRLGAGGMAVVFKAEHVEMRHTVAVKVLPLSIGQDQRLQSRFTNEMRIVARLRHANIVGALDAGRAVGDTADGTVLWYMAMEYVPGMDLEEYVIGQGALSSARACNLIYQVACALDEIHKYQLVHRDIKPSNIMVTAEDQAKLLDFGLSRQIDTRVTCPGTMLGTIDFMAPEQARDASSVDIRADIYSLGVTLFWCLTGKMPHQGGGFDSDSIFKRFSQPVPSVVGLAPGVPAEMDTVLARMMARNPADRYATPQAVMRALLPFLKSDTADLLMPLMPRERPARIPGRSSDVAAVGTRRILVVDDDDGIRQFCKAVLRGESLECDTVESGPAALERLTEQAYDVCITDVCMPDMNGFELTRRIKAAPAGPHLKVIMFSGSATSDELAKMLEAGADDFLIKPLSIVTLRGRVTAALRLKEAQDRSDLLNRHLLASNEELERNLNSKESDLVQARNAMVLALARLVEHREGQAGNRLVRMQHYCRELAEEAATTPGFASQVNEHFITTLVCSAPLHDLGKIGLPDHILMKPGKLTAEERIVMQTHTTVGADTLKQVARQHGFALAFLQMAADIARHHHERWDGQGYPDQLAGDDIPLAARIVTLCDVYDALRSRRSHKPPLAHSAALQLMSESCQGQFDPGLFACFVRRARAFERVFREHPDA